MTKKSKIKLLAYLVVPVATISLLSTFETSHIINNQNIIFNDSNDKINSPSTFTINQTYRTNKFNFSQSPSGDVWEFNNENNQYNKHENKKLEQSGEFFLLSHQENKNLNLNHPILDFAREINEDGSLNQNNRMENTLELDLNTWKPIGMDDDLFLQKITFDINGFIKTRQDNKSTRLMDYNITKDNFDTNNPPNNFDNLDTEKITYIGDNNPPLPEKKLLFNVLDLNKNKYKYQSADGYCYILLEIIHQKTKTKDDKPDPNAINRLLITPKIGCAWNDVMIDPEKNLTTTIPSQDLTITLKSDLFSYNESLRISNDSYISDNQRFSLYEKPIDASNDQNQQINSFLTLHTAKDANEVNISPKATSTGYQIPSLNIDTSNFYFSNDYNQLKNKEFLVEIEGIEIKNGKIYKNYQVSDKPNTQDNWDQEYTFYNENTLNLSFKIKDSDFENQGNDFEKIYSFDLLNQSMIEGYPDIGNKNAGVKLEIAVKALYENGNRIPFKYQISSFKFIGQSYNSQNTSPSYRLDAYLEIDSSNEVIVKTSPLDFSFTKMNNALLNTQKQLFEFNSDYSSNVFDDSYFVDANNNQRVETNYQVVYNELKSKFNSIINEDLNFKNSLISLDLLNQPFSQISYTSSGDDFRTSGKMSLRYAPVYKNKYFRNLEVILRAKISKNNPQNELINVSINQARLKEIAKNIKTMDLLVLKLNQLDETELRKLINIQCLDSNALSFIKFNTLKFNQIGSTNYIQATFNLYDNFYTIIDNKRINQNVTIKSDYIEIATFNPDKVTISLNEDRIRNAASQCNDYQDFQRKYFVKNLFIFNYLT